MKKIFTLLICIALVAITIYKFDFVTNKIIDFVTKKENIVLEPGNKYQKNKSYSLVQITDNFIPYSYQDLLNIFYTTLDRGYESVTFHCPDEYLNCVNDIDHISQKENSVILTTIGNYVSPFNNFSTLTVEPSKKTIGDIILTIKYKYTYDEIDTINKKLDEILNIIVKPNMSNIDIVKEFHDYIINNTKYDKLYERELKEIEQKLREKTTYPSDKAISPLVYGYAICSGYTDIMAILLDRLNIENIKIASDNHIWNALKIDGEWKHIDLTWDDPVSTSGIDTLLHKFYLIDTKTLKEYDIKDHKFDNSIYYEIK